MLILRHENLGNHENNEESHVYRSRALYRRQMGQRRRPQGRGRSHAGDREAAGASAPRQQGRSRRSAGSREERLRAVAGDLGLRPRQDHAQGRRPHARAPRRDLESPRAGAGQGLRRGARRGGHLGRHHRLVRGGGPPQLRPHRARARQGHASAGGVGAGRHRRRLHAVELSRAHGGALAAGCSLILKASEETPGACIETVRCFADAGLPAGVLNLVFGVPAEVSEHLLAKDAVRKISFTGSIPVGKHLAALAAKGMKRTTMELGGHSPVVVFADADAEKAADTIAAFKYRNAGQVCISPTRFYVQEDAYKKFLARFSDYAKAIKLGDGLEKGITMGPMANARRIDAMESFVADARSRGGNVVTGGKRHSNQGFFYEPTIVTDVPDDSKVMTQEPFGPIAPIVTFKTFDEVVERANSLPYGLAAYAFTNSNATAAAIGDAIASGMVGVNSVAVSTPETPFGGVKESGHGSEGGIEGLGAYLNTKFISQA